MGAPSLRLATVSFMLALISVLVLGAVGNVPGGGRRAVRLAPLAPVLGAVLAFRADTDPAGELAVACPLVSMRLVVIRAAVVAGVAAPVGGVHATARRAPPPPRRQRR